MLVVAMKEEYIKLKQMIEKRLTQDIDEDTKEDLQKKLEKVNWAISEMDRYKKELEKSEPHFTLEI